MLVRRLKRRIEIEHNTLRVEQGPAVQPAVSDQARPEPGDSPRKDEPAGEAKKLDLEKAL